MKTRLIWDEAKRKANLTKHGLDFTDAWWVLASDIRLDISVSRSGEHRIQSFAYVYNQLRALMVVHVPSAETTRIVSFRAASTRERNVYHEWLAQESNDS